MLLTASHDQKMHSRRNPYNLRLPHDAFGSGAVSSSFLSPGTPTAQHRSFLQGRSAPPSPGLPAPNRKQDQRLSGSRSKLVQKLLLVILGALALAWWGVNTLYTYSVPQEAILRYGHSTQDDPAGGVSLPDEPSAIIMKDKKGRSKWTVSIPPSMDFPLRPAQYTHICKQSMEISHHLAEQGKSITKRHRSYYQQDPLFVDVLEAEQEGILPSSSSAEQREHAGDSTPQVCEKSLTYVMQTPDAGMGNTLLALWMSYGLAQHEGRAFFVDDTKWAYGKYSTYFQPPPQPSCLPPPKSQVVPCPRTARHIVVSAATTQQTFGHAFNEEWEDPRKMKVQRQHKIFALLRTGYEALFKLRTDDGQWAEERIKSLYGPTTAAGGLSVGLHIRRGDLHPYEFQYSKDYLPITRFLDSAGNLISYYFSTAPSTPGQPIDRRALPTSNDVPTPSALPSSSDSIDAILQENHSQLILASDDPALHSASDLQSPTTTRAQTHIVLATKAELLASNPKSHKGPKAPIHKFVDELSGWEGGFYRDIFWGLGMPRGVKSDFESPVSESTMRIRELVGRSYLLDLKVLSGADAVVCAVSSNACRVLGVMVGWEGVGGEERGRWRNVDGSFDWKGIVW